MTTTKAKRTIFNEDALLWLEKSPVLTGCSLVTSLPDLSEFHGLTLFQWKEWFHHAASLTLSRCSPDGVTIFYQSDIHHEGEWIDKAYLCQKAAESLGQALVWHKIVCRIPSGEISYGRPGYSHLICFSQNIRTQIALATPNVLPQSGEVTWTRGMGTEACRTACQFVLSHTSTRTVVDPFCGHGTVLAIANALGLDAIGVEVGARRAKKAKQLRSSSFTSSPQAL